MTQLHAAVRLPYFTGLPRDVAINTFNFRSQVGSTIGDMVTAVHPRLTAFYNTGVGAGQPLALSMGKSINRPACTIRYYNVPDDGPAPMGDPVDEIGFTLGAAGTGVYPLPLEVAACISVVGSDSLSALPIRRRRGRVYIGPLTTNAISNVDDNYPDLASGFRGNLSDAANRLMGQSDDVATWSVWSRATWVGPLAAESAWRPIVYGWVDNEFDTQRRREMDPTARTTFGTPLP